MNRNGIDVDPFQEWAEQVKQHPETGAAAVTIRHRWDGAFAVDTQCGTLEEAGESFPRGQHTLRTDWPPPFGQDSGPTPGAEILAAALGACVATTYVAKAAAAGIVIDELEVETHGRVDLQGLLELNGVQAAFAGMSVTVRVRSAAPDAELKDLGQTVTHTSPVYASLANPVPLHMSVERTA